MFNFGATGQSIPAAMLSHAGHEAGFDARGAGTSVIFFTLMLRL